VKDNINFSQFCSRQWLDHCDENKAPLCITYTEKEYKIKFNKWLLEKYAEELEEE
jgi:hypothetical protein|tara:strand:- start:203 stop:367 length:165 start_codon:yes stop_codon:yes gene_type:complete